MENDETKEVVTETTPAEEVIEEVEGEEEIVVEEKTVDYRGKLNATNNFLKKEGYVFDESSKSWVRPAATKKEVAEVKKEYSLSPKDTLALIEAKISADDLDEVVQYAGFRKMSVAQALKDRTLQAVLREKQEERRTAEATSTKTVVRTPSKTSASDALEKVRKTGELPDSDTELQKMIQADLDSKKGKR